MPQLVMVLDPNSFPPHFLCIGAQKACTSWLNIVLKSDINNRVFIPYVKETFFLNLLEPENPIYLSSGGDAHGTIYQTIKEKTELHINQEIANIQAAGEIQRWQAEFLGYLYKSLTFYWTGLDASWYKHLFSISMPDQVLGDITPDYSFLQDDMVRQLSLVRPDLKIILITRDPVERDLSQLKMQLLPRNPIPTEKDCISFLRQPHVMRRSEYKYILNRWKKYFGEQSILVFDVKDVSNHPASVIKSLSHFLGVELCVLDSVIAMRDNANHLSWSPPQSVLRYLEDYYEANPVF
jgi:hypothetical protein